MGSYVLINLSRSLKYHFSPVPRNQNRHCLSPEQMQQVPRKSVRFSHLYPRSLCLVQQPVRCFFFFLINFCWSVVGLQCCVSFCCIAKWINFTYTYILSFLRFYFHIGHYRVLSRDSCAIQWVLISCLFYHVLFENMSSIMSLFCSEPCRSSHLTPSESQRSFSALPGSLRSGPHDLSRLISGHCPTLSLCFSHTGLHRALEVSKNTPLSWN